MDLGSPLILIVVYFSDMPAVIPVEEASTASQRLHTSTAQVQGSSPAQMWAEHGAWPELVCSLSPFNLGMTLTEV